MVRGFTRKISGSILRKNNVWTVRISLRMSQINRPSLVCQKSVQKKKNDKRFISFKQVISNFRKNSQKLSKIGRNCNSIGGNYRHYWWVGTLILYKDRHVFHFYCQ
jgi:hypothetical protein